MEHGNEGPCHHIGDELTVVDCVGAGRQGRNRTWGTVIFSVETARPLSLSSGEGKPEGNSRGLENN